MLNLLTVPLTATAWMTTGQAPSPSSSSLALRKDRGILGAETP